MNIALVTETFPPEVNGVAMTLGRLVEGLRGRGHGVQVVRPCQPGERLDPRAAAVDELLVPGLAIPFYRSLRIGFPVGGSLRRRWRERRPDVVHLATEGPLGFAALQAARRLGIPVTSSFHTNFHQYGSHYGVTALRGGVLAYLRWFHNRTRCTLVPTKAMVGELEIEGFVRLGVLSRGVDTGLFDPARRCAELRRSWGAGPDTPVAMYVGRMAAEKNLALAVRTFARMRAAVPELRVVFVGDGPERASVARSNPDYHYAGMRRGRELAVHYASADIFVFPSVTETFGNVVTEALASGLVFVGYDYAAAREHVVNGHNGWVAPLGDEADFNRIALEALRDRGGWPELRAAARATATAITWQTVVERLESQFAEAAATAAPAVGPG